MENVSLKKLILNAWGIPDDREYAAIGPDWLTSESFDIDAKFPADTPVPKVREMIQALLMRSPPVGSPSGDTAVADVFAGGGEERAENSCGRDGRFADLRHVRALRSDEDHDESTGRSDRPASGIASGRCYRISDGE